ncbi:succinyl-diaminopimelate desuccinylase [Salsuginibacillus halophilus]|uniref:Succinyl-diaminopimelate desuccinylase n=1 Tax=Salsuginibacillus halophilus TaxID=517424 RepID=A0A2P8HE75_9BACI|nr:Sapep family Mn(2+)-dependent dipeptidase [Salsuginibacillus halophilus]PSL44520.1 succinyl-diaminopimelate desuccinylase [Salsuginibacillus halophilus]
MERFEQEFLTKLDELVSIESVYHDAEATSEAPFGKGPAEALNCVLRWGEEDGMIVKNVDGYAGHIQLGEGRGEDAASVLVHLDVVPPGPGWTKAPFALTEEDGRLYGRGVLDNKGAAVAAYMALKQIKTEGVALKRPLRFIAGIDEERHWACMDHYFQEEPQPKTGFVPDADFPVITKEKGILDVEVTQPLFNIETSAPVFLQSLHSGERENMVPAAAEAELVMYDAAELERLYKLLEHMLAADQFKVEAHGSVLRLDVYGTPAHGAAPDLGDHAAVKLGQVLEQLPLDQAGLTFVQKLLAEWGDSTGRLLGVQKETSDAVLTVNAGVVRYDASTKQAKIVATVRAPAEVPLAELRAQLDTWAERRGMDLRVLDELPGHSLQSDHPLAQMLLDVYEGHTGERPAPLAIGGATYARVLKDGAAFGPLFPNRENTAHQADEWMYFKDLLLCTKMYEDVLQRLGQAENL